MAKKVPLDKLADNINKILADYENGIIADTRELSKKFAQKGAQAVRQQAKANGWGDNTQYDKGWSSKLEQTRLTATGIVYNKDRPGLAHLLEHGHAKRGGGRTRAFPHIAPVEEKISEEYYKAVKESL